MRSRVSATLAFCLVAVLATINVRANSEAGLRSQRQKAAKVATVASSTTRTRTTEAAAALVSLRPGESANPTTSSVDPNALQSAVQADMQASARETDSLRDSVESVSEVGAVAPIDFSDTKKGAAALQNLDMLRRHQQQLNKTLSMLHKMSKSLHAQLRVARTREQNASASGLASNVESLISRAVDKSVSLEISKLQHSINEHVRVAARQIITPQAQMIGNSATNIARKALEEEVSRTVVDMFSDLDKYPIVREGLGRLMEESVNKVLDQRLDTSVQAHVRNATQGLEGLRLVTNSPRSSHAVRDAEADAAHAARTAAVKEAVQETGSSNRFRGTTTQTSKQAPIQVVQRDGDGYLDQDHVRRDVNQQPDFSYDPFDQVYGPDDWGRITPAYHTCGSGHRQSPVDIRTAGASTFGTRPNVRLDKYLPDFQVTYSPIKPVVIQNNGHSVEIPTVKTDNMLQYRGNTYGLLKANFHVPGEHSVDGKRPLMEMHLVHEATNVVPNMATQWVIVVVPFFEAPEGDNFLDLFWDKIPPIGEQQTLDTTTLDLRAAVFTGKASNDLTKAEATIAASNFFTYTGSLTTPPCSENVRYFVLKREAFGHRASTAQVSSLMQILNGTNARPLQNGRWNQKDQDLMLEVLTNAATGSLPDADTPVASTASQNVGQPKSPSESVPSAIAPPPASSDVPFIGGSAGKDLEQASTEAQDTLTEMQETQ